MKLVLYKEVKSEDTLHSLNPFLKFLISCSTFLSVRGVVDRRHIAWSDDWKPVRKRPDLRIGSADFEIDGFHVEDLLVTILNPAFRPYSMSVFNASLPRLRRQWLMYDIMSADNITVSGNKLQSIWVIFYFYY